MTAADAANRLAATLAPKRRPRRIFLPHQNRRERIRRLRQAFRGQLPPDQFLDVRHWSVAQDNYLMLIKEGVA